MKDWYTTSLVPFKGITPVVSLNQAASIRLIEAAWLRLTAVALTCVAATVTHPEQ